MKDPFERQRRLLASLDTFRKLDQAAALTGGQLDYLKRALGPFQNQFKMLDPFERLVPRSVRLMQMMQENLSSPLSRALDLMQGNPPAAPSKDLDTSVVCATMLLPSSEEPGLLSWTDDPSCQPERSNFATVFHAAPTVTAQLQPTIITAEVSVRCRRCRREMLSQGKELTALSDRNFELRMFISSWCECLDDWDGDPETLDAGPNLVLRVHEGGRSGDGVRRGQLTSVRATPPDESEK